jgi:hypothetical protein
MSDNLTIAERIKEMLKQNAYLKEENQRIYDENRRLHSLLNEIENLVSPRSKTSPLDSFFVKSGFAKTPT